MANVAPQAATFNQKSVVAAGLLSSTATASVGFTNCSSVFAFSFKPDQPTDAVAICKDGAIAISYDTVMIDPAWSAYYVTYAEVSNELSGRLSFYEDPDLQSLGVTQAAVNSDAYNDTWNRGHLCPNHILSYTQDTKKATFTMANVAPQAATFNQKSWLDLENHVFNYIKSSKKSLYIITGVAYKSRSRPRRSWDNIAVPDYYFKVICDAVNGKSAGFYGANEAGSKIDTFYTVEEIESIYGGRLFPDNCNTGTVTPSNWWTF
eukprot:CAMPEP_0176467646 /NCGR_PEP_ID=MMETSP0127-20121128/38577_1 /TAXON_ID=938130 /ORGANISM="Platyophrya macrostoma, Strain WH" /LENGTH=262 /DNA_ID=CAMNT_0017860975 /DNA_START=38 /DNA_END=827 /DNA_ORIENTATION=-